MKITMIGAGNIGGAIARGLAKGGTFDASDITCTSLCQAHLDAVKAFDERINVSMDNAEAVKSADIVVFAVKPWLMPTVVEEVCEVLRYDKQIIVSVAAGVTFEQLNGWLANSSGIKPTIFRLMPNIAIELSSSVTFIAACNATAEQQAMIVKIFEQLGMAMPVGENLMMPGTALASSGIAFAFRYIRAATMGGVQLGFYPEQAKEIVMQTLQGAIDILKAKGTNPEAEIDRVTTPSGTTIRGLNKMEEEGFTTAVINGLKASIRYDEK